MTGIAWLVDTAAGFTEEEIAGHPLFVVPMGVILNGVSYSDQVNLSSEEFYRLLEQYGEGAKSSQPNFQAMLDTYHKIKDEGYDRVIAVHPTSELTGSYQNSLTASQEVDLKVEVIDSRTGSYPYKKMVQAGMAITEAGGTFEEAVQHVRSLTTQTALYLQPKNLQQVRRSGRLSASQSFLAGLLSIQLILSLEEGKIIPYEKVRTRKKVFERMIEIVEEAIEKEDLKEICVLNSGDKVEAGKYVERLHADYPELIIHQEYMAAVASVHTGYGTVSIGWIKE
ncbi:DegV family protein [Macrococcus hajekii]|uniref:DegV family protein n=1 Tax=Macrococcus hajekii TaxID=198482 RepID=A0A4R6BIV6_9STAP|nr:DegV family protein [Macrococcus hajekii]TDM01528.1 DegV family protein [Macrococcus hajekii]GGB00743.1 hypothetical protein GCM10007190_06030 [Macrococcus hajekii]